MLVGYARVSTQEQDLTLQLDALRSAGCEKVFEEKASGAQRERPALQTALEYMRRGDTLVVWKLDRLARSLKQLIETVEDLGSRGIGFRSLTEAIDTTTSGGKLVFHIFAALAEFERGVIRERTLAGLQAARARGRLGGRPPALSPKDVAAAKALLRDPEITVAEVARRLGVVPSTVERSSNYRRFDAYLLPQAAVPAVAAELGLPAAAHLDHDPAHCGRKHRNVRALCQRCHLLHDRPEHRRRIRLTLRRRRALGDLFSGPYPA